MAGKIKWLVLCESRKIQWQKHEKQFIPKFKYYLFVSCSLLHSFSWAAVAKWLKLEKFKKKTNIGLFHIKHVEIFRPHQVSSFPNAVGHVINSHIWRWRWTRNQFIARLLDFCFFGANLFTNLKQFSSLNLSITSITLQKKEKLEKYFPCSEGRNKLKHEQHAVGLRAQSNILQYCRIIAFSSLKDDLFPYFREEFSMHVTRSSQIAFKPLGKVRSKSGKIVASSLLHNICIFYLGAHLSSL